MFRKVLIQAVCAVCPCVSFGPVFADLCETSDGLVFSSREKTVHKFNYLSSGCRSSHVLPGLSSGSIHESPQLKLYDGQGVASVSLEAASTTTSLVKNYYPDQFYSISTIRSSIADASFVEEVFAAAEDFNIDPLLLHAIAHVESRYNPNAVSPAGARGLMQVMPGTARQFGMTDPEQQLFDPVENLRVSSTYLRSLYDLFGNDLDLVLAAYNAGENAVIKYGYQVPPYDETQQYVRLVMEKYQELMQSTTSF